jgi:hypothetical protein
MTVARHRHPAPVPGNTAAPIRWVLLLNLVCYLLVAIAVLAVLTVASMMADGYGGIWGVSAISIAFAVASVPSAVVSSLAILGLASGSEVNARRRGAIGGGVVSAISMAIAVAVLVARTRPQPPLDIGPLAALLLAMGAVTGLGAGALAVWLRRAYWEAPT